MNIIILFGKIKTYHYLCIYKCLIMDKNFYQKYQEYELFPIAELIHIQDISVYNHNYYTGIKRENMTQDLIYVETDECSGISEYYHIDGDEKIHIGYAYEGDNFITLQEEELT